MRAKELLENTPIEFKTSAGSNIDPALLEAYRVWDKSLGNMPPAIKAFLEENKEDPIIKAYQNYFAARKEQDRKIDDILKRK